MLQRPMTPWLLLGVALWTLISSRALADQGDEPTTGIMTPAQLSDRGFHSLLLDSETPLVHWRASNDLRKHWTVKEGVLHYDGDRGALSWEDANRWTKESFEDLKLYIEWRLPTKPTLKPHPVVLGNGLFLMNASGKRVTQLKLDAGDSGVLFRGILHCQANIWCQELGSGEVNGYRTNAKRSTRLRQSCIPFAHADNPLGQWNAFLITLKNDQLEVRLNGQAVLITEPLPNLPRRGPIGLQHHGDVVEFRNIWVKEIE